MHRRLSSGRRWVEQVPGRWCCSRLCLGSKCDFPVDANVREKVVFVVCRSPKGGVGTSVVAAALAVQRAASGHETLLVDLAGGQLALLGISDRDGLGVGDWLAAGEDAPVDGLAALERPVAPGLHLLPQGRTVEPDRLTVLAGLLAASQRSVVVDGGLSTAPLWAAGLATDVVVMRLCYLALNRAGSLAPTARVVLIEEPGRALTASDVSGVLGVPIWRRLALDPAVARSVDAGVLAQRVPRSLRGLVWDG